MRAFNDPIEEEQQKPFLDLTKINPKPPKKELIELENRIRLSQ
jgi:hypothetical protein